MDVQVLDEAQWSARRAAHEARVDAFVQPHLARRESRVKHPVHDFLFTYYSQRPGVLLGNGEREAYVRLASERAARLGT